MNLYGSLDTSVKAAVNGCDKIAPIIKNKIELACTIFFLEAIPSPMVKGNNRIQISPSNRN